jgi:uncharacterized protein
MKLSGNQVILASRHIVWEGLNDPAVLKQCIPGCSVIEATSATDMTATVVAKFGPIKTSFSGKVKLSDVKPPESYRISGEGQGGLAGFASGGASVRLVEISPQETDMQYDVDAQIGGKLAMLGSRLIDSTASSLAQQFFDKFASMMKTAGSRAAIAVKVAKPKAKKPAKAKKAAKKVVKAVKKKAKTKKKK